MIPPAQNRLTSLLVACATVALDLGAKAWARSALEAGAPLEITPFFNLVLSFNRGVAFGLLNGAGMVFVAVITAGITSGFVLWWWRATTAAARLGLALILGGAVANLVDRIMHGAVTDFLDFHAAGLHWPAFNMADSALTIGVGVLMIASAQKGKSDGEARLGGRS